MGLVFLRLRETSCSSACPKHEALEVSELTNAVVLRSYARSTEKALWEARVVVVIRTRWMTMIYCDNKWPPCEGYCPNRND